jgi:hypothetical protein
MAPNPNESPKYLPFECYNYKNWSYIMPLVTHFFFVPRIVVGFFGFWTGLLVINVITLGHKEGAPFKKWQISIARAVAPIIGRFCSYLILAIPVVRRVECDYSHYLGADHDYTYERAGVFVSNHITFIDVLMH